MTCGTCRSLSSRRAWIEILLYALADKELNGRPPRGGRGLKSAKRNAGDQQRKSRPPRGGRGLKFEKHRRRALRHRVALLAEGVD